jgi:hypothetical protein
VKRNGTLAKHIANLLTTYSAGMNEIIKLNDPMRKRVLQWWYETKLKDANIEEMARHRLDSYFINVMQTKMRQFEEQGAVIEALRDRDPDHQFVVAELRKMRLAEDSKCK